MRKDTLDILALPHRVRQSEAGRHAARARGFTLVELLVVLLIIGLLVSALAFVVAGLMKRADRLTCASNLRQIHNGLAMYSQANDYALPTYHRSGAFAFDTFCMRRNEGELVNLGLLTEKHINEPGVFYCPTQNQSTSPSIARDSPVNRWRIGRRSGEEMNSSYPARPREHNTASLLPWKLHYYNLSRVIYSDFIGVDKWPATGRLRGTISAPHDSRGYNRLFGDGSVAWLDSEAVHTLRKVDQRVPSAKELNDYYLNRLDVLP